MSPFSRVHQDWKVGRGYFEQGGLLARKLFCATWLRQQHWVTKASIRYQFHGGNDSRLGMQGGCGKGEDGGGESG